MSDINDPVLSADIRNFELGINTKSFNVWYYRTNDRLEDVLALNYFDSVADAQPRRNDRIEVLASCDWLESEHATLAVKDVVVEAGVKHVIVVRI